MFLDDRSILIGSDCYWDLVTGSVCRSGKGPTAIHTKLGWVLSGPTLSNREVRCSVNLTTTHVLRVNTHQDETTGLDEQLRSFWELESLGILGEERTLYDDFTGSIKFQDGRYKVSLPWREFHEPLPDNYQLSLTRLRDLLRRLKQDPSIIREYDNIIHDHLKRGIIEAIPVEAATPGHTHYLPHHPVVCSNRNTTKVRVVYDASARSANGLSLNDCLHKAQHSTSLSWICYCDSDPTRLL